MLFLLVFVALMLSAADHWTTYLCLREHVPGWEVTEANPIAAWLFEMMGLAEGLLVDSAITVLAMAFLIFTPRLPELAKIGFLACVITWTGYAVANNLNAIALLGVPITG